MKLAEVIQSKCLRAEDIRLSIGGDEFALILYGINSEKLEQIGFEHKTVKTSLSICAVIKT